MVKNYFVSTNIGGPTSLTRDVSPEWPAVVSSVSALVRDAMEKRVSTVIEVSEHQQDGSTPTVIARVEVNLLASQASDI
jgi:hypothetical protein